VVFALNDLMISGGELAKIRLILNGESVSSGDQSYLVLGLMERGLTRELERLIPKMIEKKLYFSLLTMMTEVYGPQCSIENYEKWFQLAKVLESACYLNPNYTFWIDNIELNLPYNTLVRIGHYSDQDYRAALELCELDECAEGAVITSGYLSRFKNGNCFLYEFTKEKVDESFSVTIEMY
jgi:hypothetical protein